MLYLIEILHQTTTQRDIQRRSKRCILSKFYIKPQPSTISFHTRTVVSYRNSTSNHNETSWRTFVAGVVSYRNSTSNHNDVGDIDIRFHVVSYRNSTSNHNPHRWQFYRMEVVSYRNSTSNHNYGFSLVDNQRLYLIEILHQTTTSGLILIDKVLLTGCLPL